MGPAQKVAAWDVLAVLLSPAGIEKTRNVMTLQDVLASQGNMPGQRSSERFSFAVFGTPSETGAWGFRLEGHHLHQSISVRDNRIVSVTPSSFSVNPNRVTSGKHAGLVTLREEESLARRLYGDLDPKLQGRARISATPMDNIMSYAGRERANAQGVGVAASELAVGAARPRSGSWSRPMPPTISRRRSPRRSARACAPAIARPCILPGTGRTPPSGRSAIASSAPSFVIELGSVDPAAQHLHTIYHDLGNVLGRTG